jgi:hypothetical protein
MFVPNPWGSDAGPAKYQAPNRPLPSWVVSRLSPMRTQGSFLVILPPDYDKSTRKYPVCVLLHGAGGNERQFGTVSTQLGRDGVIFIAIRAPFSNPDGTIALKSPSYSAWPSDPLPNDSPVLDIALRDYVDWIFDAVSDVQIKLPCGGRKDIAVRIQSRWPNCFKCGGVLSGKNQILFCELGLGSSGDRPDQRAASEDETGKCTGVDAAWPRKIRQSQSVRPRRLQIVSRRLL